LDDFNGLADKINTALKTQSPPVQVTASVVDGRIVLKSDTTGLGTTQVSGTTERAVSGRDKLGFTVDPDNGQLTLKDNNSSTTYIMGADFDIVNGNEIRWRESGMLDYVPAGGTYDFTYEMEAGETYTAKGARSAGGNTDRGVVPANLSRSSGGKYTIQVGGGAGMGISYTEGAEFAVVGNDIMWKAGYAPDYGVDYELIYEAAGGETVALQNKSGAIDTITSSPSVLLSEIGSDTVKITSNGRTYWQGEDFDIVADPGDATKAAVQWRTESGYIAPKPGDPYVVTYTHVSSATTTPNTTANAVRSSSDTIDLANYGLGMKSGESDLIGDLSALSYNGDKFETQSTSATPPDTYDTFSLANTIVTIDWTTTTKAANPSHPKAPTNTSASTASYTATYSYDTNIFTLSDDGNGFLEALGLDLTDAMHYTAAQDAIIMLDGEQVVRSSNQIGESYENELIKGMTIELKGTGRVSLDVSQDAEAAVKALQSFVDEYNAVLEWINIRSSEKELTAEEKAKLKDGDYQLKWGLLRGNSLLRDSKNTLRRLTSQLYVVPAASKTSRNAIYGTMSQNGLENAGSFSISAGGTTVNIPVDPSDTLLTIATKVNAPTINGQRNPLRVGPDGAALASPIAKASVEGGKLTIVGMNDSSNAVTLGGSSDILKALQIDQQYTSLSQIGIKLGSTGKMSTDALAGTLEFDTGVFMTALETNADDVALVVTSFAAQMQTYLDNMISSSQKEVAADVTTAKGAVVREMNAIDTEIASINTYLKEFQRRLDDKQAALEKQFSGAEVSLAKLVQQAEWLSSTVAQLQKSSAGG
jgi:flagellar capping protein FliD